MNRSVSKRKTKSSSINKVAKKVKVFGKKTLRDMLLSKTFHGSFKIFVSFLLLSSLVYGAYAFMGNAFSNDIVVSQSEILSRVSKHVSLPNNNPEKMVRVENSGELKKENKFYENVKDGNYIIIYKDIAIIYDLKGDSIVAIKRNKII